MEDLLQIIEDETEERKLLALAYRCEGEIKIGLISPADYAECMVLLSKKLGFPALPKNLDIASVKYLQSSGEEKMAKIGRPTKASKGQEKYIKKTITLPSDIDEEIRALMIRKELDYSAVIRVLLRKVFFEFAGEY